MAYDRREFLAVLGVTAGASMAGQSAAQPSSRAAEEAVEIVDAGPVSDYPSDGVYDAFRDHGLFVVRRRDEIFALSSICTHRGCKIRSQPDQSYRCKCHGSRFDAEGKVQNGPATRDLPRLKVARSADGHVLVKLMAKRAPK